ncbi:cd99 antigen-like [Limosa lapponica baueri]|uniref:Cd99 antigen-like n=1 Tax=Limosa lapponica baueri TaxID=1758121 RepID=A0A2I0TEZ9_LIMLA|nr:cd99 antigen-like [Limosa lapponica baueri]
MGNILLQPSPGTGMTKKALMNENGQGKQGHVVYLAFCKAFDIISHSVLLARSMLSRLKKWMVCLENRRRRGDLIAVCNLLKWGSGGGGADLLSLVTSCRTRRNGMWLPEVMFRLDMRKMFFTESMVGHWNRLSMIVVMAPTLSEIKEHVDDTISHMV